MKKILSVLLSVVMLATITAGIDFSAYAANYDTLSKAKNYDVGTTTSGTFASNDNIDYMKFSLPNSGRIEFSINGNINCGSDITGLSYSFCVTDEQGNDIQEIEVPFNDALGYAFTQYKIDLNVGVYYIKVSTYSGYGLYGGGVGTGSYGISSQFSGINESFPESKTITNNTIGTSNSIALNTLYNGQVTIDDTVDFYNFTVSAGTYYVYIKSNFDGYQHTNHSSSCITLYDMNGKRIGDSKSFYYDSNKGFAEGTQSYSLSDGTYSLRIESNESKLTGNYSFSVYSPAPAPAPTPAPAQTTAVKKPGKVTIGKVTTAKKGKIKTTWKKKSGVSGYQIYYSRSKSFKKLAAKKTVSGGKKTSYTGKNFTKGKKYYVKVRAYKTVNGKKYYGSWSSVKSVKCK